MKLKSVTLCLLLGLALKIESKLTPIVHTSTGPIQGEILETVIDFKKYSSFKGIPYAEPPLGYRRFKPPVPKIPWTHVLKTTVEGAICIQKDFIYRNYTGSEDCLYLNVYTPKLKFERLNSNLLPVMVWIYGGSFKSGYGNSSVYGPDFIIEEDVILVTLNYRLGAFGFLNVNHENATGNAGLKDQNLALRWIKNNIIKFGGNPESITIFGQSAGGVSVDFHSLSKMSQGLFHRSISMSASPLCVWGFHTAKEALKQAFMLGAKLGKITLSKEELLRYLYEIPAIEIVKKVEELSLATPPFKPSIENTRLARNEEKFITECSYRQYLFGNFRKLPHLTGFTSDETLLFVDGVKSILNLAKSLTDISKSFPASPLIYLPITNKIITTISNSTINLTDFVIKELIRETTDLLFVAGIDMKQKMLQAYSYPVYYYRFSYDTQKSIHRQLYNIDSNGTAHADDLAYLFHMTVTNLPLQPNDPTYIARRRMVRMWTNFAKYGNPTPDGEKDTLLQGITWPPSTITGRFLDFGKDLKIGTNPINSRTEHIETANLVILPIQTGCVGDVLHNIPNINLISSKSITSMTDQLSNFTYELIPFH